MSANQEPAATFVLRGVRVLGPEGAFREGMDLWVESGRVRALGRDVPAEGVREIPGAGLTAVPGLFDMHVNLREPGGEDAETIATGALAAAAGGFTGVACMPGTPTPNDTRAVIDLIHERARTACGTQIHPVAAITRGLEGRQLTEMWELGETGAVAVSDDGRATGSSEVMRRAMEYARMCGLPVLAESDEEVLRGRGTMHEGYWSTLLGLRGIPAATEEIVLARNIALAAHTGARLHAQKLSTARGVELVRQAKARGLPITAEVTAHHLWFTDESVRGYDPRFKTNPPFRTAEDRSALRRAVLDGTIDAIVSDHSPHTSVATDVEFDRAPFGVIGLETVVSAAWQALVVEEGGDPVRVLRALGDAPREILRLPVPRLEEGERADLTLLELGATRRIDASRFLSMARNCPFAGLELPVAVRLTVAAGRVLYEEPAGERWGETRRDGLRAAKEKV